MIRAVIDTNLVVSSALCIDGKPARIFELIVLERIKNFTSKDILTEIELVMERPKIAKRLVEKDFIIENFRRFSTIVEPEQTLKVIPDDPYDDKFIECAVTADADYIISGDTHLLILKKYKGISIVSAGEFLKLFEEHVR